MKILLLFAYSLISLLMYNSCMQTTNVEVFVPEPKHNINHKEIERKPIVELTQDEIRTYSKTNPCYLPLLKDTALYEKGNKIGFDYEELFNPFLPPENPYRNRYLVGDFNVLDQDLNNKGTHEKNPDLKKILNFSNASDSLISLMDSTVEHTTYYDSLMNEFNKTYGNLAFEYKNFFDKVWQYKMPELIRAYGSQGHMVYASGQAICLCEAHKDTIYEIARFATSAKRLEPVLKVEAEENEKTTYIQVLPLGKRRYYYAGKYYISSKNWESRRTYDNFDLYHDSLLGGGSKYVTYYKNKVQLPNFLLMKPDSNYPYAMLQNGIHEYALIELNRRMLGTANSIGCIRVSAFAAKFLRWWTPQNCPFFVIYDEERYFKKYDDLTFDDIYPFKTKEEGDSFRAWLNDNKPMAASTLKIDRKGDHQNCFVLQAYDLYKNEYLKYINDNNVTKSEK